MSSEKLRQPVVRDGAADRLRARLDFWLENELKDGGIYRCCITCVSFVEATEQCRFFNNERPPARVIAYGCNSYTHDDEIPF